MELLLARTDSDLTSKIQVNSDIFNQKYNEMLIHQIVVSYLARGRAGTRAQKTRSEVSGGGAKPWRQKGTGRARAGTIRSPIWRGGGRAFAAKPQDHTQKVNKKMYRGAIRSILSELVRQNRLLIVEELLMDSVKTKDLLKKLNYLNVKNVLIIVSAFNSNLYLSSRNIPMVCIKKATMIDPISLLKYKKILITKDGLKIIEEVLG